MIKTISIFMKHNDSISFEAMDENSDTVKEISNDYMPDVGIFGGDQTEMTIDNETGKIIGWVPIKEEDFDDE